VNYRQIKFPLLLLTLATIFIITLSIAGGVRSYTPVPTWDMWGPFLSAYKLSNPGALGDIFSLHNEHRIIIARLLFWMDMYLFNGNTISLIILNYLLAAAAAYTFALIVRDCFPKESEKSTRIATTLFTTALCFTWMQQENFTWAFQNQFFAAQLAPLVSMFLLYKASISSENGRLYYWLACTGGVLCAGTMANGVIALPLMAATSFIFGFRRWQSVVLSILSAVVATAYFYNFHTPGNHGSLSQTLTHSPLGVLHYVLLYIGSPAYFMTGKTQAATLTGLFILLSAIYFSIQTLRFRRNDHLIIFLLIYLLYIGGSALGTAGGRLVFGLDQALSSRYTTPAVMGWATLAIIYVRYFYHRVAFVVPTALLIVTLALIPQQLNALQNKRGDLHEKLVAALAAELQIRDQKQIQMIFPSADYVLKAAIEPSNLHYSIFGDERIRGAHEEQGYSAPTKLLETSQCQGHVDLIRDVEGTVDYLFIQGWIYNAKQKSTPSMVRIIDRNGKIVGRAVTGMPRSDVRAVVSKKATYSGFSGYINKSASRGKLTIVSDEQDGCHIEGLLQDDAFTARPSRFAAPDRFASTRAIYQQSGWNGYDADRSYSSDYKILGTYASQQKSTNNKLVLKLQKGESIYYRASENGTHRLIINGFEDEYRADLPAATEWTILKFDQPSLPESFTVTLTDDGQTNETWSAVALRVPNSDSVQASN